MVNFNSNVYPHSDGGGHIPPQPLWVSIIRVVQVIFSIIVMSLAAFATSYFYLPGYGMAFFTFVWTILFLLYIYITPHFLPHFYIFWAHIAFETTVVIFWLTTFALLADYTRAWDSYSSYGFRYYYGNSAIDATKAATAFAVLDWLLFCATLGITFWLYKKHHGNPTVVDGTAHSRSGGFKFGNLGGIFSRRRGATDAEKGVGGGPGAVNETGQPVEMHNQPEGHLAPQPPQQAYLQPH